MNSPKQRRIVLIDNRFQLRMAVAFIALQVLLTGVFATGLYLFMDSEVHARLESAHASYLSLSQMLLPIVVILSALSITLSIVLTTGFVIIISHKIAGPMYRFNAVLESLAQRRFETITQIRPNDQLGEMAASLNKTITVIRADIQQIQSSLKRLRENQIQGNAEAIEAEIALIEKSLDLWK